MIAVFGSINIDLVFTLPSLPRPGETVVGTSYRTVPGGKGANQAVAAVRDGAKVAMIGRVGRDSFGTMMRDSLREAGVEVSGVLDSEAPTGCAAVCVDGEGRNLIAVAGGANLTARAANIPEELLGPGTTLLLQMEVPVAEIQAAARRAKAKGAQVILGLGPALKLPLETFRDVDVLVANEIEAAALIAAAPSALAQRLAEALKITVIVTLGEKGAVAAGPQGGWQIGTLPIKPVDTTAAGDQFTGVLAASIDRGLPLRDALRRASVAAGLACLVPGAQPSLQHAAAIEARLDDLAPAVAV
ncbi:MAG: ribokinase [Alphaproteobacteria bacterium]|nr:ribokinase [Alphaproteobacteria bacterium]